ncbi:MAG: AraC family transcriptional regulator [Cellulosilyticaceae bacterium]
MLHNFQRYLEQNTGFETNYLKVLYYDLEDGYCGTYRSYEYNRICTILSGSKHVTINKGDAFIYNPEKFILLPPHSSVEMIIKEHTKAVVYEISDRIVDEMYEKLQYRYQKDIIEEHPDNIRTHLLSTLQLPLQRINSTLQSEDQDKAVLVDVMTQELVYHLYKNHFISKTPNISDAHPVEYAIQYFQHHISENISLTDLAHSLNMSPSHFSSTFKNVTGFTPKAYLNMIKVKKSKHLLLSKQVTEVAYELGFDNISYYIDLFKRHYGETPKQYALRQTTS